MCNVGVGVCEYVDVMCVEFYVVCMLDVVVDLVEVFCVFGGCYVEFFV